MSILKLCMLALVATVAAVIVKQWKSDFLPLVRLGIALLFGICAINTAAPLVTYLSSALGQGAASPYTEVLFRALGIAVLTQVSSDICRECGEATAAGGVELIGKLEILLLCVPLINELLSVAAGLLALGE